MQSSLKLKNVPQSIYEEFRQYSEITTNKNIYKTRNTSFALQRNLLIQFNLDKFNFIFHTPFHMHCGNGHSVLILDNSN